MQKETARENLREAVYEIARTARVMKYEFDGIDSKFQMPANTSDKNIVTNARAFYDNSPSYNADFLTYELPTTFRADLLTDITAFEDSLNPTGTAIDNRAAAMAKIGEAVRRGMIAWRTLNGVVKNKYRNNVGKLAVWLSASHIEKAPSKPKTS